MTADPSQAIAQLLHQMTPFRPPHIIQLCQRVPQPAVQQSSKPLLLFFPLRHGGGDTSDHSGQSQQGDNVHIRCRSRFLPQRFRRFQIRLHQIPIYLYRRRVPRFYAHGHFHVSAVNLFAHDLPQPQLVQIKSLRHPQLEIQEPVVDALDADAHGPAILLGSRLCVAGHRETFKFFCWYWSRLAHKESDRTFSFPGAAGASMASSANCRS